MERFLHYHLLQQEGFHHDGLGRNYGYSEDTPFNRRDLVWEGYKSLTIWSRHGMSDTRDVAGNGIQQHLCESIPRFQQLRM